MKIALAALDSGRLGIAAQPPGSPRPLWTARSRRGTDPVRPPDRRTRECSSFSQRWRRRSTRLGPRICWPRGSGRRPSVQPCRIVAKMLATDTAMRVTTDAVQVRRLRLHAGLPRGEISAGGEGDVQIFEGTNQIQRLVISRQLLRGDR